METSKDDPTNDPEREPTPVPPEEAEEVGIVGGSGGPASIIYGDRDDDEADEHGDRLSHGPEESR